jgi:SDR family mycofactocin-dependent oxidoreductase
LVGRLDGKVALITGAARGQGRAHAVRLASEGASIIGTDVCAQMGVGYVGATEADLKETVRLVEEAGSQMLGLKADVRSVAEMDDAVARGRDEYGRLDVVIANAGIFSFGRLWEITEEQWQETLDVNLTGVFHTLKSTVPALIEQGDGGSIVIISSVAGLRGVPFAGHYVATKHGAVGLCRTLANELGEYRIRVNSIHPAGVLTPMNDDPGLLELIAQHKDTLAPIFMNALPYMMMEPEAISNMVAFLASDDSKYMTGVQIPIDMGTLIR